MNKDKRENFYLLLAKEKPFYVPHRASFCEHLLKKLAERYNLTSEKINEELNKYFDMDAFYSVELKRPKNLPLYDYSKYYENIKDKDFYIDKRGVAHIKSGYYHFTGMISPLRNVKTLKEIEEFPIDEEENWETSHLKEEVEKLKKEDKIVVGGVYHLYEDAWAIRGYEEFLMDMYTNPDIVENILDRLTRRNLNRTRAVVKAEVDLIITGDDVANQKTLMFSPDIWRKYLKVRWAKIYEEAKRCNPDIKIWYHSDGNVEEIVDDLIEIGVDILNPVQPECMDPVNLRKRVGDNLIFDGTIGTQSVFPFGTPEEIEKTVKEMIENVGKNGLLILSPTHLLEPEVPIENIESFFSACKKYGKYKCK